MIRTEIPELMCQHEEADTRIMWHIGHISQSQPECNVSVRCDDTDVLIILLAHDAESSVRVWMDVGKSSNNTRRYIDVSSLADHLGVDLCKALPGLHAFTGCDYTAAFYRKGKFRPLTIMEKGFVSTLKKLDEQEHVDQTLVAELESFVCSLYGKPNITSVNDARLTLFHDHYAPKSDTQPLEKLKRSDPSNFPPCHAVLLQKIKRSNLVACMWKNAEKENPCAWKPDDNGWKVGEKSKYELVWFEGEQVPDNVCVHINEESLEDDENDDIDYYCSSDDDSDDEI